ncbi:PQQ-binding-like beta-propeller repeat protein [Herpetosiphon sp. NSE202]|uniref:beta-alanine-activating enzyme beta-propeller domain-containing protein n=1 Tax=Herpetosiphon sp. NSE202 TaxID=3351349 RepID=UPI00362FDE18
MALIKRGGTSRLTPIDGPDGGSSTGQPDDATRTFSPQPISDDSTRGLDATRTIAPADPDSTRGLVAAGNDSTRSIAPPVNPDATRGINPNPDATRGINENPDATRSVSNRIGSILRNQGVSRLGTEDIRNRAPNPDATRLQQPGAKQAEPSMPQASSPTLKTGTVLEGRYVIEGVLGIGGMSVVYKGRDTRFKDVTRFCAIKEMFQNSPDSQTRLLSLKNFEREAGLLATLNHPAIPKVYDFFEETGRAYLVMELIEGHDLETVLEKANGPLEEQQVGRWAIQICDVLNYLHGHEPEPIIFRDLKPSNMIVTPSDRIVLIDFGIARVFTRTDKKGTMIGTEGYSPPEQYRGIAEARGDVYALGATLHHLLTNIDPRLETPFTFGDRPIRQLNPSVSPEVEAIVMKSLEYDMANRWGSAAEFQAVLMSVPGLAPAGVAVATPATPAFGAAIRRGGKNTEVLWKFRCEDEVRSSPFVRNGTLYIGCYDTNLYALDTKRGEFRWKKPTEGGISSTPTVWDDMVIVGSDDGNVYAFDTRAGTQRWVFRTEKPVRSSPRVQDRLVYFGSDDYHMYAVDATNGRQIWRYRGWQWIRSSPCLTSSMVIFGSGDGSIVALDLFKGGIRWKQKLQGGIVSSAAANDTMVLVGCMDNNLHALDLEGGWPIWKFRTSHYVNSSPIIIGNRAFVGGIDGNVYAVDLKNGKQVWQYNTGAQIVSSPVADSGRIYIGAADGTVYCLDAGSGTPVWTHTCEGPIVSTPAVVEGVVYIGSMDHNVYALRA